MTTTARPAAAGVEPQPLVDPDEEAAAVEVLIAEARARARRRRRWYAVAALLALVGCLVAVFSGRSGAPADRLPVDSPAPPRSCDSGRPAQPGERLVRRRSRPGGDDRRSR